MQIRRKIKFILHRRHAGQTTGLGIRMRVTMRAQSPIDFPTGITIDESDWDESKGYAIASCLHASSTNATIDEWRSIMNDVFARFELIEKRMPTSDEIKDAFNTAIGRKTETPVIKDAPTDFYKVFDKFIADVGVQNNWTSATTTKFKTLKKQFKKVHPKMTFAELDDAALVKMMKYFSDSGMRNTRQTTFIHSMVHPVVTSSWILHRDDTRNIPSKIQGFGQCVKGNHIFDPFGTATHGNIQVPPG